MSLSITIKVEFWQGIVGEESAREVLKDKMVHMSLCRPTILGKHNVCISVLACTLHNCACMRLDYC